MSTTVDLGKITASVTIGTTTTGAAGTNASVSNSGTTQDAVLNFTIPRGAQGVQGPQGIQGNTGPAGPTGPQGPKGDTVILGDGVDYTLYNTTGNNTDGAITQQAVTKKITEDIPIGMVNVEHGTNTGPWEISQEFDVKANDLIRIVVDGNLVKTSGITTKQAYFGVRFTPTGESYNYVYLVCSESGGAASGDLIDYITPLTHKELEYIPQSDGKIEITHRITAASHFVAEITKISELVYQSAIIPTYIQGVFRGRDGVYSTSDSSKRITTVPIDVTLSQIIKCDLNSAYRYNIVYYDKYGEYVKARSVSAWSQYQYFYINWDGKVAINVAFDDDSSIDASTFNGLTLSLYNKTALDAEIDTLQQQVDSLIPQKQTYNYLGERIDLNTKSYKTEHCLTMTAYGGSDNRLQSLATYGDIMIIGRHVEVSGGTSYLLYLGNTYLQEVILPHTGYSAIHANTSCFGEASSYTLPLLYTSQWNEERACFVYEINDSYAATLKRVIDPANLDTSIFGAGPADWIVGDGFLYSIAYILDSPYPAAGNGLKVCKFALPTGNGVITLQDSDILESYEIEPCFVRQDSVYHNGKIYTLFGGDVSPYDVWRRMQVLDVCQKKVVTICDMQWATQEPEAISVKDDVLVFMFNSMSQGLYRFVFD